jgi:hypothetical protein
MSSLSFGVMSRKVGQSPGSCPLVQPNTGHCRGSPCAGSRSPLAADVALLASAAALAAFLAALLLFFLSEGVVAAALGGVSPGGCVADASEPSSAAIPSAFGVADRAVPLADGDPPGSVESARWLSHPSSDITSGLVWGLPLVLATEVAAPGGPPPTVVIAALRTLFPSASFTIRSSCASVKGYAVTVLITVCAALLSARSKSLASPQSWSGRRSPNEANFSRMHFVARAAFSRASSTHR